MAKPVRTARRKGPLALLGRLALFLAPVALYFALFAVAEPYNYFGWRQDEAAAEQIIYRVRRFVDDPQDAVIFGDSRLAHLDMQQVEELAGRRFSNLAFGGAAAREMLDLCDFALETNPSIDTIYMEVSFYTLNTGYDRDRTSNIRTVATNPLAYLCNFNYHLEMLNRLRMLAQGEVLGPERETAWDEELGRLAYTQADYTAADGTPLPWRRQLMEYNDSIRPVCEGWQLNEAILQRLVALADTCRQRGIQLTFVLPPVADSVYEEIICGLGIRPQLEAAVQTLRDSGARVLDMECTQRPALDESLFFDGFHVDTVAGLPLVARMIFAQ